MDDKPVHNTQLQYRYKPPVSPKPRNHKHKLKSHSISANGKGFTASSDRTGVNNGNLATASTNKRKESVAKSIAVSVYFLSGNHANKKSPVDSRPNLTVLIHNL